MTWLVIPAAILLVALWPTRAECQRALATWPARRERIRRDRAVALDRGRVARGPRVVP